MGERQNVVVVARDAIGTGGGTVALETARALAALGHGVQFLSDVDAVAELHRIPAETTTLGIALSKWMPATRMGARLRHALRLFAFSYFGSRARRRYERLGCVSVDHNIESFGGDIVVLHNVFIAQFRSDRRTWFRKTAQFFNPAFGFRLVREQIAFRSRRVKAVIAVSQRTLDEAKPYLRGDKLEFVIHSGIDLQKYRPLDDGSRYALRRSMGISERFMLLFVGHEFERKRLDLVLKSLTRLPQNVCLTVLGGRASSTEHYAAMAQLLGVAERVQFLGTMAAPQHYFQTADALVLPSDYETWGLVVVEALACGTPVLMTPVGCASEVIIEGKNGFIVDYSPDSIADKVSEMLSRPDRQQERRVTAREVAERYSWEKVGEQYLRVIQMVRRREDGA